MSNPAEPVPLSAAERPIRPWFAVVNHQVEDVHFGMQTIRAGEVYLSARAATDGDVDLLAERDALARLVRLLLGEGDGALGWAYGSGGDLHVYKADAPEAPLVPLTEADPPLAALLDRVLSEEGND